MIDSEAGVLDLDGSRSACGACRAGAGGGTPPGPEGVPLFWAGGRTGSPSTGSREQPVQKGPPFLLGQPRGGIGCRLYVPAAAQVMPLSFICMGAAGWSAISQQRSVCRALAVGGLHRAGGRLRRTPSIAPAAVEDAWQRWLATRHAASIGAVLIASCWRGNSSGGNRCGVSPMVARSQPTADRSPGADLSG